MLDEIIIVSPRGFCAGVERAVKIVEYALEQYPPPLFCRREIVHNQMVVNELREKGVAFVEELAEVPEGATVIFSAHGVPPSVHAEARQRQLHVIDATCPFVIKVHNEVKRFAREGYRILLIGHATHDEIVGIVGEAPEHVTVLQGVADAAAVQVEDPDKVAVMTQTTLSVNETEGVLSLLRQRFPRLQVPSKSDICYATHNRQFAARRLAELTDLVLVLGAANSSNTNRLAEVVRAAGKPAALICRLRDLDTVDLQGVRRVGVTAGASTPEHFVQQVVTRLQAENGCAVRHVKAAEEEERHLVVPRQL